MCGRFTQTKSAREVEDHFEIDEIDDRGPRYPRYNIAPRDMLKDPNQYLIPVVRFNAENRRREFGHLEWGFVRNNEPRGKRMINAKSETAFNKWPWRQPIRKRRCLIPADGFYEWAGEPGKKQSYRFTLKDERLFAFAGLWDRWRSPDGEELETFTVMTTTANDLVRPIHPKNRMPVILNPDQYDTWLNPEINDPPTVEALLSTYPDDEMRVYRVGDEVKRPRFDDPLCVEPIEGLNTDGELF